MVQAKLDSNRKHPGESLVGQKINDWEILKWYFNTNGFIEDCKDKYCVKCKCGREYCMRWQSFTNKTKCCRVCQKKERQAKPL